MPEILHRCVAKVMAKGHDQSSAYAICRDSLNLGAEDTDEQIDAAYEVYRKRKRMTAAAPVVAARVLARNSDGSGIVEVPITVETPHVDYSLTSGGGPKDGAMLATDLAEMADNVARYPAPMTVGFADQGGHDRAAGGPSAAFIESAELRGGTLWARIWVSAARFAEIVQGMWRGFSIEAARNLKRPTAELEGWALTGGIFTNNPAFPVNFKIAASLGEAAETRCLAMNLRLTAGLETTSRPHSEVAMSEAGTITVASHEAKLSEIRAAHDIKAEEARGLAVKLEAANNEVNRLAGENRTLKSDAVTLQAKHDVLAAEAVTRGAQNESLKEANEVFKKKLLELGDTVEKLEDEVIGEKVRKIGLDAIAKGLPPAVIAGFDKNSADWVRSEYHSLEMFEKQVLRLTGAAKALPTQTVASGHDPNKSESKDEDESVSLTPDEKKVFDQLKLKGSFVGVTNEEEARARAAALKEGKK